MDMITIKKKTSHTDIQKISCLNSNINVNGVDITQIPQDGTAALTTTNEGSQDAANTQNGNSLADRINFESDLVNICINYNQNEQIKGSPVERTCEECFTDLSDAQIDEIFPIEVFAGLSIETLEELCDLLEGLTDEGDKALAYIGMDQVLGEAGVPEPQRQAVLDCLVELGLIITPPP